MGFAPTVVASYFQNLIVPKKQECAFALPRVPNSTTCRYVTPIDSTEATTGTAAISYKNMDVNIYIYKLRVVCLRGCEGQKEGFR